MAMPVRKPAAIGGMGSSRTTLWPITVTGVRGPGTLVTTVTTERCGSRDSSRTVHAVTGNGSRLVAHTSRLPACRWPLDFATPIRACTVRSRCSGSATSTGSSGSISDTRLSETSMASAPRTDTGTSVRSESARGCRPRRSSAVR